jgi:diamine N-acetyltransferase
MESSFLIMRDIAPPHGQKRMMTITFRAPALRDAGHLAELGRTSFCDAFAHLYSPENLKKFLDQAYSEAAVAADIVNPRRIYLVAEQADTMIGYCKLGLDMGFDIDLGPRRGMELKQLYLRGAQTGSGLGSAFMTWAIDEARARDYDDIILSVYSGNVAGQRFYARHGFCKVGETIFMVGDHKDDEYLFGLRVTA